MIRWRDGDWVEFQRTIGKSYKEIGKRHDVSAERVRQIMRQQKRDQDRRAALLLAYPHIMDCLKSISASGGEWH